MNKNACAQTPPMGWNSWDCYGASVTEQELRQNIDYMAEHLKSHGWEYIVCDIQWYEPTANSSYYHKFADLCMDEYGRLCPAPNRFPSAADGSGFTKIAAYAHEKGLKFGIHIMRGIPRQAVHSDAPIKGTDKTAKDIALNNICPWNSDMYGQINNESTLAYGGDEIQFLRHAIDKCGRPVVLSLSPGPAMVEQAEHLRKNANMWRITNDLWDSWENIMEMFSRCHQWSPYVSEGCYPDCDMLPVGHISIRGCEHGLGERQSRLSRAEQRTMFTLWCIFRSPMMLGCELTDMDEWTKSLVTNDDVLGLLKKSRNARQILRTYDLIVWKAEDNENNSYIAFFNITNWKETYCISLEQLELEGRYCVYDMWRQTECGDCEGSLSVSLDSHDAVLYRLN